MPWALPSLRYGRLVVPPCFMQEMHIGSCCSRKIPSLLSCPPWDCLEVHTWSWWCTRQPTVYLCVSAWPKSKLTRKISNPPWQSHPGCGWVSPTRKPKWFSWIIRTITRWRNAFRRKSCHFSWFFPSCSRPCSPNFVRHLASELAMSDAAVQRSANSNSMTTVTNTLHAIAL